MARINVTVKRFAIIFLGSVLSLFARELYAQCNTISITYPASVCKNASFDVSTPTTGIAYEWDYCTGDLSILPTANSLLNSSVQAPYDISVVKDAGKWYCFAVGYNSSSLSRIDLGADPRAGTPVDNNLGNPGGLFANPTSIKIKKYDGTWFGLVYNQAARTIILLDFGSSLTNSPTSTLIASNIGGVEGALDFVQVNTNSFVVVVSDSAGNVTVISFTNGLQGGITTSNIVAVGGYLVDIEIVENCNAWNVFVLSYSARSIARLDFGGDLTSTPSIVTYAANLFSFSPYRFWMGKEGDYLNAMVANIGGGIATLDIGIDPTNSSPEVFDFGNLNGSIAASWSIYAIKESGLWTAFTFNGSTSALYRLSFPQTTCGANLQSSQLPYPGLISYSTSGIKNPVLTITNADGSAMSKTFQIEVQANEASSLSYSIDKLCVSSVINFTAHSTGTISNPNWSFGDGVTSTSISPDHQFSSSGVYTINFSADNDLGCTNTVLNTLNIYSPPTSSFTSPTGLICTNNEFTFVNNTVDNFDGNLTYQWLVDNNAVATTRDLHYAFTSGGDKEVKLKVAIPGCADETAQTINNIQTGPTVGFTQTGQCEDNVVTFSNSSSGSITGYAWDFGNGNTSTATNPTQTFVDKGIYSVSLQTTGANGCVSQTTKNVPIYSLPQPDFSLDLPPFSCSGTPSQFNDLTPNPTDSNLSSWVWNFGDAASGTSADRNPLYTFANAGDYNVSLTATTNFGCTNSTQKTVTITASPQVNFNYTPACVNQGTRFTDASGTGVKSWMWNIAGSTYSINNPTQVFASPGTYSAMLTVTGTNDCVATITKSIVVPATPTLSFSSGLACEGQSTTFTDTSLSGSDLTASRAWDFAGLSTGTGATTQYAFAKVGSYSVKLSTTQQSGCVYSLSKTITVNATPTASFTSTPSFGTSPLNVQFTNTSTGASTYLWHFNDQSNATSTVASPSFQFTELGDYVVDLLATNSLGCSASVSGKISVIVPLLDLELEDLQLVKDPTSGTYRVLVKIKNNSNYTLASVDVVINISGNALIKETINTSLAPDAELDQLLTNQILPNGSLLTYLCASLDADNDNDPYNNSKCEPINSQPVIFNPYPNPNNGTMQFQWIAASTEGVRFEIFNSIGQLVFEQTADNVVVGLNQVIFKLDMLNTGSYYFRFTSNSVVKTLPIQIVR